MTKCGNNLLYVYNYIYNYDICILLFNAINWHWYPFCFLIWFLGSEWKYICSEAILFISLQLQVRFILWILLTVASAQWFFKLTMSHYIKIQKVQLNTSLPVFSSFRAWEFVFLKLLNDNDSRISLCLMHGLVPQI